MFNAAIQSQICQKRQIHEAPVYYPTLEEFRDFPKFISRIEKDGSDRYGIVRVVPPLEWEYKGKRNLEEDILQQKIKPVKQYTSGKLGAFRVDLVESKKRTVEEYRKHARQNDLDLSKLLVFNQALALYPYMKGNVHVDFHSTGGESGGQTSFKGSWAYNKKQYTDGLVGSFEYDITLANEDDKSDFSSTSNTYLNRFKNVPYDCKIEDIKPHKATGSFLTANGEKTLDEFDFYCIEVYHNRQNTFYILGQGHCHFGSYRIFGVLGDFSQTHNGPGTLSPSIAPIVLSREYFEQTNVSKSDNGNDSASKNMYNIRDNLLLLKYQLGLRDESIVEKEFWRSINTVRKDVPMYGADQVGTIFKDKPANGWNVSELDTILRIGLPADMPGITKPMLYFGQYRAMFAWHKEDFDLNSINFLHHGKPKIWYAVCRPSAKRFESLCKSLFGDEANKCPEFMRHKNIFISPKILKQEKIQYVTTVQHENEFILTFPEGYHAGFNTGFNVAESVNFSSPNWVPYGRKCSFCRCFPYTFRMDIDHFCERIRNIAPHRLPSVPIVGDRILVRWDTTAQTCEKGECFAKGQEYYLCRVKRGTHGNKFNLHGIHDGKPFILPFDPEVDDWKWNCLDNAACKGTIHGSKSMANITSLKRGGRRKPGVESSLSSKSKRSKTTLNTVIQVAK